MNTFKQKNIQIHKNRLFFLRRRFISTNKSTKKSYIQYQTHYIYKRKEIKAKKRLEILKEGRKKKWGVAIMSFI